VSTHHLNKRFMVQVWDVQLVHRATGRNILVQVVSDWLVGAVRAVDRDEPGWTVVGARLVRESLFAEHGGTA
jgi:hypothetical protein